jgi:hypothetical protein
VNHSKTERARVFAGVQLMSLSISKKDQHNFDIRIGGDELWKLQRKEDFNLDTSKEDEGED